MTNTFGPYELCFGLGRRVMASRLADLHRPTVPLVPLAHDVSLAFGLSTRYCALRKGVCIGSAQYQDPSPRVAV
jgi:hypothetical protein